MSPSKRYAKKQAKARQRRRRQAHERLERDRCQAQQSAEALHQALETLGLPENLVAEIAGRLRSQQQLLGKIVGVIFASLFGCRTPSELCRVRGGDKQWPSRILGALPKRSWLKRLRRLALEILVPLWRHSVGGGDTIGSKLTSTSKGLDDIDQCESNGASTARDLLHRARGEPTVILMSHRNPLYNQQGSVTSPCAERSHLWDVLRVRVRGGERALPAGVRVQDSAASHAHRRQTGRGRPPRHWQSRLGGQWHRLRPRP